MRYLKFAPLPLLLILLCNSSALGQCGNSNAAPAVASVDSAQILLGSVRLTGESKTTLVACMASVAGQVREKSGQLNFTSFKKLARQAQSNRKATRAARLNKLARRGKTLCLGLSASEAAPSAVAAAHAQALSQGFGAIGRIAAPFSSAGSISSSKLGSASSLTQIIAGLQSLLSCATIALSGSSITIDFGTGCTLHGISFSGVINVALSTSSGALSFSASFANLSAGQAQLSGELGLTLSTPAAISTDISIAQGASTSRLEFEGTGAISQSGLTLDGDGSVTSNDVTANFSVNDLQFTFTSSVCPHAGSVVLALDGPDLTLGFSSETPSTGIVSVQYGSLAATSEVVEACIAQ